MNNCHYIIFHNAFDKIAGTERVIANLLELLAGIDHVRVTLLLASEPATLALDIRAHTDEIVYLSNRIVPGNAFTLIKSHGALLSKVAGFFRNSDRHPNTVCLTTSPFLAFIMSIARPAYRPQMRIVSCEHFALSVSGSLSKIVRRLIYSKIIVVTLTEADRMQITAEYRPLKCVCIPNASPFPISAYDTVSKENLILSVGRLSYQKGFDLLLDAFQEFHQQFPEWRLLILGDDYGEKEKLERMIKSNNLGPVVTLLPAVSNIETYYRKASFYVLSSRFEGLPMVMIEAMSFSLPIVAFDCPTGPADLINGDNGILVPDGDVKKLSAALRLLAGDSALLVKQSQEAQQMASIFSKKRINKIWLDLFSHI